MKKLLIIIILLLMVLLLSSCGNKQWVDLHYEYTGAYIHMGNGEWAYFELQTWRDYDGEQLQLKLEDGTYILVSSINCILTDDELSIFETNNNDSLPLGDE